MLHAPLDPDETAACRDIIEDLLLGHVDERREVCGKCIGIRDVIRVDVQRLRHEAHGHLAAIAVGDRATRGLYGQVVPDLAAHALRQLISRYELQPGVAQHHDTKKDAHHVHHRQDVLLQPNTSIHLHLIRSLQLAEITA